MLRAPFRLVAGTAVAAAATAFAIATPSARAHDAPMAIGARHGHMVHDPWVMSHWLPFDELEAEQALGLEAGQLAAFLYDDHHTIAQLAAQRGIAFDLLVARLANWTDATPDADRAEIERRIRLVLVSGHLAQHVMSHVFHGSAHTTVLIHASGLSAGTWAQRRRRGWSYSRLIGDGNGDIVAVEQQLAASFTARQADGVASGQTPPSQGLRLAARQNGLLDCWLKRPSQRLDAAAPYGRRYLRHAPGHTVADVPTTRAAQAVDEAMIVRGLAGRPPSCWQLPAPFEGDPGRPLTRRALRALARVPTADHAPEMAGPHRHG